MPLEDTTVVDAISTDENAGKVFLTIFDAWDWTEERAHLEALQDKINAYLDFIQSGQISEAYPASAGHKLGIRVITKYPLPIAGVEFLNRAAETAAEIDVAIHHQHLKTGE